MELDQLQMVSGDTDSAATHRDIMKQELDDSQEVVDFEIDTDHTDLTTNATTITATATTTTVDPSALETVIPVDCPKLEKQIIDQTLAQESKQAFSGPASITTTSNGSAMTVPTSSVAKQQTYTSGRNTMSNKSLGLFQCGTKLSESRRCRLIERECNELKEVVCSTNHLVLVLDNIRRLSREYILTLYQLVQATILAERSLIDQLHQDCAELESELNHWESKYEFLSSSSSSSSSVPNQFVPKSIPPPTPATATQQNHRFYFDSGSSPSTIRNVCRKKQSTPSGGDGFSSDDNDDGGGGLVVQPGLDLAQLVMLEQGRRVQEQSQLQRTHQLCSSGSGPGDGGANSSYSHLHQNQANLPMLPSELCEMSMMETINEPSNNGSCSGFATAASGSGRGSLGTVHSNQADHDSVDPDNDEDEDTAYAHYVDEIRQLEQSQHHQVSRLLSSSSSCSPESMPIVESPNDPNGINKSLKQQQQPPALQSETSSVQASILLCDSSPLSSSSMASSVAAQQSLGFQNSLGPNENPYLTRDNGTSVHHHHNNLISGDNLCSQMISAAVAAQRQFKLSMDRLQSDRFSLGASADGGAGGQRVPASASSLTSVSRGQLAGSSPSLPLVPSSSTTSSKPLFRCEHAGCDYQTNMRQRLAMHRRIHDGEMLYSCDISGCGYQSNYKGNIKIHKKHRHRIEPGSHQSTTYIVNGLRSDHTTTTPIVHAVAPALAESEVVLSNNNNNKRGRKRIQPSPNSSGPHNNSHNNFGGNAEDSLEGRLTLGPDLLNSTMLLASTPASSEENSAGLSGVGSSIMSPMTAAGLGTSAYENGCSGNESGQRDGDQYHIFECRYPSCNYRSKWKQCLTAHQLLHIGVKPFKCDFAGCNYRTNFKGNVNVHKRVHRASQFRCKFPGCHFTTPWKNSFTIHQRNHQRNQPEPSPPPTTTTKTSKTILGGKISQNVVVGPNMLSQTQQSPLCLDRKSHPNQSSSSSFRRATPPLLRAIEQNLLKNNHHHHNHNHHNNNLVQTKRSKLSGDLSHKQKRSTIVELDHYRHNRNHHQQQQPSPEVEEEEDDDIVDEDIQLINDDDGDEDEDEDQLEHYWNSAPDHNPPNVLGGGGGGGDFVDFDSQL